MDLDAELARLAQVPLDEFVRARNELAARLRDQQHSPAALRVHALPKPPLSAWAVNQLYWRARPAFDALMRAGQSLRKAQEASLSGRAGDVREAGRGRDRALLAALQRTLELLAEAGQSVTPAMRLRIATNLEALAAHGGAPPGAEPGHLSNDLDLPGFEVFDGLSRGSARTTDPAPPQKPAAREPAERRDRSQRAKVVSFEAIANGRRALAEAEREAAERRTDAHRAEDALRQALDQVKAAEAATREAREKVRAAERLVEEGERRVQQARDAVARREQEAARARDATGEAQAAVERARIALDEVKKKK